MKQMLPTNVLKLIINKYLVKDNMKETIDGLFRIVNKDIARNVIYLAHEFINNANLLIVDAKDVVADVKKNPKKWLKAYFAAKREDAKENK